MRSQDAVTRSAFKVTIGSFFALILGFIGQVFIASIFGTGAEMDAYLTALVVPLYLQSILLTGLSFVFIPAFVQDSIDGRKDDAWRLAGTFFWLVSGILAFISILGSFLAPEIISLTAPGLRAPKAELAQQMLTILSFSVPLIGLASLCEGIQNARGRFFWPALAPAIGAVANIVILVTTYKSIGPISLALGYLVSAGLRAGVSVLPVLRHGWRGLLPLNDRRVKELGRLITPFIVFGLLTRSTPVFERYFASNLPDGDLSFLGYASKIGKWVMVMLGHGISVAIFPAMSRAYAIKGNRGLIERSEYGFRLTMATALPALAILSVVSVPLVGILFERGAFLQAATLSVSRVVPLIILSEVLLKMLGNVVGRTYYVKKDTLTGPLIFSATFILYFLLAKSLTGSMGYIGLAIAQPLHSGLVILILIFLLKRKLRQFRISNLFKDSVIFGLASVAVFIVARLLLHVVGSTPYLVQVIIPTSTAMGVYFLCLYFVDRKMALALLELSGVRQLMSGVKLGFRQIT